MPHKSRLGVIVIDCRTEDLTDALVFWSAALGYPGKIDSRGKYAVFDAGYPRVLLQAVDHAPRVHLDLETDDIDAEVARLTAVGASVVHESEHGWTVMEAPTGHRFCIVSATGEGFDTGAVEHAS